MGIVRAGAADASFAPRYRRRVREFVLSTLRRRRLTRRWHRHARLRSQASSTLLQNSCLLLVRRHPRRTFAFGFQEPRVELLFRAPDWGVEFSQSLLQNVDSRARSVLDRLGRGTRRAIRGTRQIIRGTRRTPRRRRRR